MFGRENLTGILLLVFCAIVALIMINAIVTGEIPSVPANLRVPFTVGGIVLMGILFWQRFSGRFKRK